MTLRNLVLGIGICAPLVAQPFTLIDANVTFRWASAASPGGHSSVGLRASSCSVHENLWSWHWCYAVRGAGAGTTLKDTGHGAYAQSLTPRSCMQAITDVDRLGLFDATVHDLVTSTGPHSGHAQHVITIANRTGSLLELNLYLFADFDYNGSTDNYTLPLSGPERFAVASATSCGGFVELWGAGPDHYRVSTFNDLAGANEEIAAGVDLSDRGLPFGGPGSRSDFTGALQWNLSLVPFSSRTIFATTGHNDLHVGVPGTAVHSGPSLGGATGPPTIAAPRPVLGADLPIVLTAGAQAASATLLFGGLAPQPLALPGCGGPTLGIAPLLAAIPVTLAGGRATLTLRASQAGLDIAGVPFSWQVFVVDPTSTACVPLVHSDVLTTTFGD